MLGTVPEQPTCSVVVPSYRRPAYLRRCLSALLAQDVLPAEIIVVAHVDDQETQAVVAEVQRDTDILSLATVARPGVIAAMEVGVRQSSADIVALSDDDARPRKDWLALVRAAFREDDRIAGVGGRDNLPEWGDVTGGRTVGHVGWFGRIVGNHHLGGGPRRAVTMLKGVNCAYRRDVLEQLGFDHRLRGGGAQVHWELALGLAIVRGGWRLLYDPAILVGHDEAPRLDGQRLGAAQPPETAVADAAYNEALLLTEHLSGARRLAYLVWSSVVGHRASPGLVQAVRFTPKLGRQSWRRWQVAYHARREARRAATRRGPRTPWPG
jgi:cellulose synthase/poly-beta-1,6-N-acetylglucosamine synthase-like glycosyltransferase